MRKLENHSTSELVDEFLKTCLALYEASERDEIRKYNRLMGRVSNIERALRGMSGDQRYVLLPLYTHPNIFVRLMSAMVTSDLAPLEAKGVFEGVEASRIYPYSADAAFALRSLEVRHKP